MIRKKCHTVPHGIALFSQVLRAGSASAKPASSGLSSALVTIRPRSATLMDERMFSSAFSMRRNLRRAFPASFLALA